MAKRMMSLADLYGYFHSQGKTQHFSCEKNDGDSIVVTVDGKLSFSKDHSKDGLCPVRVQINYVGDTLNNSRIKMEAQEEALPSAQFRPLLAFIHEIDGKPVFEGHNYHNDENGERVYDERPVGVMCEAAHIEHDDEYDKDYAVVNGYVWELYSDAAMILERDGKTDVSAELEILDLGYSAEDDILVINKFHYNGCTFLGQREKPNGKVVDVKPAMPGSNVTIKDFSVKNEKYSTQDEQFIEAINTIKNNSFDINNTNGKEETQKMENLAEMENKKKVSDDDSTPVDPASVSDDNQEGEGDNNQTQQTTDNTNTGDDDANANTDANANNDQNGDNGGDNGGDNADVGNNSVKVSFNNKEFSVSLMDKQAALQNLVNETYVEDYEDYYSVDVYEEEKVIVMHSWSTGKHYRQNFNCKKDVYSLKGDRVEVFTQYLTQDEMDKLSAMKENYSVIEEKLSKYESEPEKEKVLSENKYNYVRNTEEFTALTKDHFDFSVEEVRQKADEILLNCAAEGKLNFSIEESETKGVKCKTFASESIKKSSSRYGNIFN
jgi:hypothetical protein